MDVLVDTSVWIAFFRGRAEDAKVCEALDYLLSGDEAVVNEIVLTELLPSIVHKNELSLAACMESVRRVAMDVDWSELRRMQVKCLSGGINKVGVPDLMIAQQAIHMDLPVFSVDRHFRLMAKALGFRLWPS